MTSREGSRFGTQGKLVYGRDGEEDRFVPGPSGLRYENVPLDHDPRWRVDLSLDVVGGRLVVTELTLRASGEGPLGSGPPVVPESGITSPLLRKVPVAELVKEARAKAQRAAGPPPRARKKRPKGDPVRDLLDDMDREFAKAAAAGTKRARRRDDEHYLTWAVAYAQKLAEGSHAPVSELAHDLGVDRGVVRDRLHIARTRGLLTEVPEGSRIGGELTDKAKELLARMKEA